MTYSRCRGDQNGKGMAKQRPPGRIRAEVAERQTRWT